MAMEILGAALDWPQWSGTKQWLPDWVEQIMRDSVEVEPGIFEVRDGTTYAPTTV
ncbi:MAG: hypothetical protein ACT4NY_08865 [Pseudonocardiales bacterium]